MFIIEICNTNSWVVNVLNHEIPIPEKFHKPSGMRYTQYLVMEEGKPNRIIDHEEFAELKEKVRVEATQRRFYYCFAPETTA